MRTLFLTLLSALWLLSVAAEPARADLGAGVGFSEDGIPTIAAWYREHDDHGRSHGGGKKKTLSPGIAKYLVRGKSLPPGIARQPLPPGLSTALPARPRGFERVVVDGRVLLVEVATHVIHGVLTDMVRRWPGHDCHHRAPNPDAARAGQFTVLPGPRCYSRVCHNATIPPVQVWRHARASSV